MTYLVMECYPSHVILLDNDGRFLKAANKNYEVGQTVTDPVLMRDDLNILDEIEKRDRKKRRIKYTSLIAACVVLIFGINFYRFFITEYSSFYLSINPEIRIDLNRFGFVVDVEGENKDGAALLFDYYWKGKDKITVSNELINKAADMGYLEDGGKAIFYIDAPSNKIYRNIEQELQHGVASDVDKNINVNIEVLRIGEYGVSGFEETSENTTVQEIQSTQEEITTRYHHGGEHHKDD